MSTGNVQQGVKTYSKTESIDTPVLLTGEDLFAQGDIGWTELVQGKLIRMSPTGYLHGRIENRFGRVLGNFVEEHKLGEVLVGEVRYQFQGYSEVLSIEADTTE